MADKVFRVAEFVEDLSWYDVTKLADDPRTVRVAGQLYASMGSISANLAEGYSRGTGKDRARYLEYSLGEARESREWYRRSRHILGEVVYLHRLNLLTEICKMLSALIPDQRSRGLREARAEYDTGFSPELHTLLHNVPLP
ncbi:MAG: four helix bundle protein [Anaerolineales bacterium]|nr:four helix bundle protein [Anaerolineales bacterium]MDW8325293.1 four helix bundle protein [Anaerolineales bacterium]